MNLSQSHSNWFQLVNDPVHYGKNSVWFVEMPDGELDGVMDGVQIPNWTVARSFYPRGPLRAQDFMLDLDGWPVFSSRLQSSWDDQYPGTIQFLPLLLSHKDGTNPVSGYAIANILPLIDCLDRIRTKASNDDWTPRSNGTVRALHPFCLRRSAIQNYPILRIRDSPAPIIVRADAAHLLESSGFTGVRLQDHFLFSDD